MRLNDPDEIITRTLRRAMHVPAADLAPLIVAALESEGYPLTCMAAGHVTLCDQGDYDDATAPPPASLLL